MIFPNRMLRVFCLLLFLLTSCAPSRWQRDYLALGSPVEKLRNKKAPRVLFVGNSFSMGVPAAFRKAAAARGIKVETRGIAYDGWSLSRHARAPETWTEITESWDIVVFQERSDRPAKWWERNGFMIPALGKLAARSTRHGALPVLFQTWGYREQFGEMNPRVRNGCRTAADVLGGITVVPVGDFWQRAWASGRGAELFMPDGKHPTTIGNELTAQAFCEAFWGKADTVSSIPQ